MLSPSTALLALAAVRLAMAQNNGCIQLTGSSMCPGFSDQYINPSNLQTQWAFFSDVTDVASFDREMANYLAIGGQFAQTKYNEQLGCTNTSSTYVLQYERTFLCSKFSQISYTAGCYTNTNVIRRMACQQTCLFFAASENYLVDDPVSCGTTNTVGDYRQGNLTQDFTSCTDWTTLSSNNTDTCVLGQINEPNCGFGRSTTQLCNYCNPQSGALVNACCGRDNVDISSCGYTLNAAQISSAVFSPNANGATALPNSESSNNNSSSNGGGGGGLSGGAIAGITIACVVVALKLVALFWFCCWRRKSRGGHTMAEEYGIRKSKRPKDWQNSRQDSDDGASPIFNEKKSSDPELVGTPNSNFISGRLRGGRRTSLDSSAYSSSRESRNLVSSYRDHYSRKNIVPGSVVTAIYTYNANLPDELHLEPENLVTINKIFDDGWASGTITDGPGGAETTGFFPLVVVSLSQGESAYDAAESSVSGYSGRASSYKGRPGVASSAGSQAGDGNIHDPAIHQK